MGGELPLEVRLGRGPVEAHSTYAAAAGGRILTIATVLPYTPVGTLLRFVPLPVTVLAAIAGLTLTYLLLVQVVKAGFYRRHAVL